MLKNILTPILLLSSLTIAVHPAFAFDETYTHPYLTKLIVEEWNKTAKEKISPNDLEKIVQGSQDEDNPPSRCLNHFYNPLNGEGLSINGLIAGYAAPAWSQDKSKQSEPLFGGSYTWADALQTKQNNNSQTFFALGHILHLTEDMGVPAHTRNDEHALGDGFEAWLKDANSGDSKLLFDWRKVQRADCPNLSACLNELALYSNNNFFSDNTVNNQEFSAPYDIMSKGKDNYLYANGRIVALLDKSKNRLVLNSVVFRNYWQELAPKIIGYGLRVLDLYKNSSPEVGQTKSVKSRGQISAGGIKITAKAPKDIKFNWPKPVQPVAPILDPKKLITDPSSRFFPVIDMSRVIPWQFLNKSQIDLPLVSSPQVAGLKIFEQSIAPAPIINTPVTSTPATTTPTTPTTTQDGQSSGGGNNPPPPPPADTTAPTAIFVNLAKSYKTVGFTVNWQGQDNITAASDLLFDVDYKLVNADWVSWLSQNSSTSALFNKNLPEESFVRFRLRARDSAGNIGQWQEAETVVYLPDTHNPLLYEKLEKNLAFYECSGDKIHDSLSNDFVMNKTTWINGPWGCAARQGADDREALGISLREHPMILSEATMSFYIKGFECSFNHNASSHGRVLFSDGDIMDLEDWAFGISLNQIRTLVYINGQGAELPQILPEDGAWHNIILTANSEYFAIYLDGVLKEQVFGNYLIQKPIIDFNILTMYGNAEYDELAVWSRSLSSSEILDYYNKQEPLKP